MEEVSGWMRDRSSHEEFGLLWLPVFQPGMLACSLAADTALESPLQPINRSLSLPCRGMNLSFSLAVPRLYPTFARPIHW